MSRKDVTTNAMWREIDAHIGKCRVGRVESTLSLSRSLIFISKEKKKEKKNAPGDEEEGKGEG